jgi:hypothetical protein
MAKRGQAPRSRDFQAFPVPQNSAARGHLRGARDDTPKNRPPMCYVLAGGRDGDRDGQKRTMPDIHRKKRSPRIPTRVFSGFSRRAEFCTTGTRVALHHCLIPYGDVARQMTVHCHRLEQLDL